MKRSLLVLLLVVLLVGSVGCGGGTKSFPTPTPSPTPTTDTTTFNLFASLRAVSTWPSSTPQLTPQQIRYMRHAAKVAHYSMERAPIPTASSADIYLWQVQVNKKGEWSMPQNSERKITDPADLYTAVHLSFNGDRMVFSKIVNGYNQIFFKQEMADGSWLGGFQLTSDAEHHFLPHISADGSKVVFTTPDPNSTGDVLCIVNSPIPFGPGGPEHCLDFSSTTPALKGANLWHASWAPNDRIVFEAWGGPLISDEIFMVGKDGSGLTQITNNAGTNNYDECPSVNSDGTAITFDSWNDATKHYDVIEMNLATKQRYKYSGADSPADGWDPLFTKYTFFWVAKPMGQVPGGLELYYMSFSPLRLTNNNLDDFFSSSPR
jgi:hypothetical protein